MTSIFQSFLCNLKLHFNRRLWYFRRAIGARTGCYVWARDGREGHHWADCFHLDVRSPRGTDDYIFTDSLFICSFASCSNQPAAGLPDCAVYRSSSSLFTGSPCRTCIIQWADQWEYSENTFAREFSKFV